MSTPGVIMMICDGPALLIIVQNDDEDGVRHYGYLVMPRRYFINDNLRRHFSSIFSFRKWCRPLLCLNFEIFLNFLYSAPAAAIGVSVVNEACTTDYVMVNLNFFNYH